MKIVLSGATGFIGRHLVETLSREAHTLMVLTRHPSGRGGTESLKFETWDAKNLGAWVEQMEGADALINLSGESIAARRWSPEQKKRIYASRIDAAKALVQALAKARQRPKVLINASAVGYYGNVEQGEVTESCGKGRGFLADTCDQWEKEARVAEIVGTRVVLARFGVVLEKEGGALQKMLPPFQFFMGGPLGSGRQWFPWIHREDAVRSLLFCLQTPSISGPVNVASPEPVRLKEFCTILGKVMNRPSWAPVPAFVLKILLGEMSEMLLTGQRALPKKLIEAGFEFRYPKLEGALSEILNENDSNKPK